MMAVSIMMPYDLIRFRKDQRKRFEEWEEIVVTGGREDEDE